MAARPGQQVHALARVRKLQQAARDALPALHALASAADTDVWGRYPVEAGAALDAEDLWAWCELARAEYPGRNIELLLVVHVTDEP